MSKTPLVPMADYVVAATPSISSKTASGLYVPEKATEKPSVAEILAVGPDVKGLESGDKIVYRSFTSTEVKVEGTKYLLVKQEDILAKVK